MKVISPRVLSVAAILISSLMPNSVKGYTTLGRVYVLTIDKVVNDGLLQDDYECGGNGDNVDEISLKYQSADQEILALNQINFGKSQSTIVNRKFLCIDTATFYMTETDRLQDDEASRRIGCTETSSKRNYLTLTMEAKSCYRSTTNINYKIYYHIKPFETNN